MNQNFDAGTATREMDREFGWRGRLGLITPSAGWTPEEEWPRMMPEGVGYLVTRMPLNSTTPEALKEMGRHAMSCAELLATAEVDIICYGCTVETILQGLEYDLEIARGFQERTGIPAKTMARAVLDAFETLKMRKLAFVTPYISEINAREIKFLESIGYSIEFDYGMEISKTTNLARVSPETVYEVGARALTEAPEADGLFISCGNLRSLDAISRLEAEFDKPVVTSNQALLWSSLRSIGVEDKLQGFGRLFEYQS